MPLAVRSSEPLERAKISSDVRSGNVPCHLKLPFWRPVCLFFFRRTSHSNLRASRIRTISLAKTLDAERISSEMIEIDETPAVRGT
jgi:hypothetical protein